jgi:hypothetical protein
VTEAPLRSYDDLPESDVATVLQVPLLWGGQPTDASNGAPAAARHRASERTVLPPAAEARTRRPHWADHPLLQVLEVGVVSALLVLALFGVVLLALARWMP